MALVTHDFPHSCVSFTSDLAVKMSRLPQFVGLIAAASALSHLASAQTVVRDNTTIGRPVLPRNQESLELNSRPLNLSNIVANESTVAPAAEAVGGELVLTDAILNNLTELSLTNVSLFAFAGDVSVEKRAISGECKVFPGDLLYPVELVWQIFNLLTGDALVKTVPVASVCYDNWGDSDSDECAYVTEQWSNVSFHYPKPSSLMFPLWEGATCLPTADSLAGNCTLGGYSDYIVS